jgi:hypothetical protein
MGLRSGKAQSIFLCFYSANSKKELLYQRTDAKKGEKRVGNKRISVKKHKFTSSSTRGLAA